MTSLSLACKTGNFLDCKIQKIKHYYLASGQVNDWIVINVKSVQFLNDHEKPPLANQTVCCIPNSGIVRDSVPAGLIRFCVRGRCSENMAIFLNGAGEVVSLLGGTSPCGGGERSTSPIPAAKLAFIGASGDKPTSRRSAATLVELIRWGQRTTPSATSKQIHSRLRIFKCFHSLRRFVLY